ncbi:UvrD-helicase domain-containing protein [Enterococcus sp. AZ136]|uniref:UvrD-helicase domain-containing protein n=1 Tax=Enterococcus sp. AZ136 TaxID=2774788 RepID=UPI003D2E94A4
MSSPNFNKFLYKEAARDLENNEEQKIVYNSTGNCVVLAGPGSGKSKVLTLKLAKMINEDVEPPQGVACLTYNKECARELKEKLNKIGIYESSSIFIGTVHSFCLNHVIKPFRHLVKTNLPNKIKVATSQEIYSAKLNSFNMTIGKRERINSGFLIAFDVYRRTFVERTSFDWATDDSDIAEWIINYETELHRQGLIDYDDMVLHGLWMIEEHQWIQNILRAKFPILAVDEYQDLGTSLDKIVRLLCLENDVRLLAVGDPDQSIYGFTGAKPHLLNELANRSEILKVQLKKNYRSREVIVKASIATLLEDRDFISSREGEGKIEFHEIKDGLESQCDYICQTIVPDILSSESSNTLGDIGILYIDKNDGDKIAERVTKARYQFIRVDGNAPYNKNKLTLWIENCAMWCSGGRLQGNPRYYDIEQTYCDFFLNIKISEKKIEEKKAKLFKFLDQNRDSESNLYSWLQIFKEQIILDLKSCFSDEPDVFTEFNKLITSAEKGQLKDFKVSSLSRQVGSKDHLNLYTLHSSKGLEFKYVIIFGLEYGRIPWININEEKVNESRRLFYVGITRAKDEIHLLYSGWYCNSSGRTFSQGVSPFVLELEEYIEYQQ